MTTLLTPRSTSLDVAGPHGSTYDAGSVYDVLDEVDVFTPPREYIYVNIANHIATCVASSQLRPGQRLPSEEALAQYYGVSKQT